MASEPAIPLLRPAAIALLAVVLAAAPGARAAQEAGEVVLARGVVTAQPPSGPGRVVGSGSELRAGDTVTTSARSVAVLKLVDGTRITLRPDSAFQVEAIDITPERESAALRLFKGGLRAVTGFISKRNSDGMRLNTSVATIGIRGTELDARLCGQDCAAEAERRPAAAGRVAFATGKVIARAANGDRARDLTAGAPVYSGDVVLTSAGAHAVLGFRDDSRVTLLPDTEFRVDDLVYDEQKPERNRGFFALVRGGLRAVTGAIGKRKRSAYRMRTAVATIGIRGTGYDLACQGLCVSTAAQPDPSGDGLFASVWDGSIAVDGGEPLGAGDIVFIGKPGMTPVPVPQLPIPMAVPRPDTVPVPSRPPPPPSSTAPEEGLYVSCYTGNCAVETPRNTVELDGGEASFVGAEGGPARALPEVPAFQAEDPVLRSIEVGSALNLDAGIEVGGFQCSVN